MGSSHYQLVGHAGLGFGFILYARKKLRVISRKEEDLHWRRVCWGRVKPGEASLEGWWLLAVIGGGSQAGWMCPLLLPGSSGHGEKLDRLARAGQSGRVAGTAGAAWASLSAWLSPQLHAFDCSSL